MRKKIFEKFKEAKELNSDKISFPIVNLGTAKMNEGTNHFDSTIRQMIEEGIVIIEKGGIKTTLLTLTEEGKQELEEYIQNSSNGEETNK